MMHPWEAKEAENATEGIRRKPKTLNSQKLNGDHVVKFADVTDKGSSL